MAKPYPTRKQTQFIVDFLKPLRKFLIIAEIEKTAGITQNNLAYVIRKYNKVNLSDLEISKLLPVLALFGFEMPLQEITIKKIQDVVCTKSKISLEQLKMPTRKHEIVEERYIAIYFCRELLKKGPTEIAKAFENFDHATMSHAWKTIKGRLENDKKLQVKVADYEKTLQVF